MTAPEGILHYPLSSYAAAARCGEAWFAIPLELAADTVHRREREHCHDFHELHWLHRAGGTLLTAGERATLMPGTLVILSRGRPHAWLQAGIVDGVLVAFAPRIFCGNSNSAVTGLLSWVTGTARGPVPIVRPEGADVATIARLFEHLLAESHHPSPGREDAVRALLTLILAHARRLYGPVAWRGSAANTPDQLLAQRFQQALDEHFPVSLKVAHFAAALGVSRSHLNESVRRATGRPASEWIQELILDRARRLLTHSTLTVAEIAYSLDFRDPSYFGRFFRKKTGSTPGDYRTAERERLARE